MGVMITRHEHTSYTWLDVLSPTTDEIHELMQECHISPNLMNDLTTMSPHTEAVATKDALKLVMDFPIVKRTDIAHPHEIKFIATKTHLITIRFEDIEAIHRFAKKFEVRSVLIKKRGRANAGHLMLALIQHLYAGLHQKLDYLDARLAEVETEIFSEREKEMVFEISSVARRLINFKQVLITHEHALHDLQECIPLTFNKSQLQQVDALKEQHHQLCRRVSTLTTTLEGLRDTNMALLTTKQNEIVKNLTIVAFVTFPLTMVASLFSMSTTHTPLVGTDHDWWWIVGTMVIGSIGLFVYFYFKRWL